MHISMMHIYIEQDWTNVESKNTPEEQETALQEIQSFGRTPPNQNRENKTSYLQTFHNKGAENT